MEIGSILHKGLELKGRAVQEGKTVDYEFITGEILNGCEEKTDKGTEKIVGINDLIMKYPTDWALPDNASGMDYETKMKLFFERVLPTRMENKEWGIVGNEVRFEFVYDDRVILHGFIDRVDKLIKSSETEEELYKVIDYKSSKKAFDDNYIKTPLQMVTYDLACLFMYGVVPVEHEYDFILIDYLQNGGNSPLCSKGYLKRGVNKLNRLLDKIDEMNETGIYKPTPCPLCFYCDFCRTNPNAEAKTKHLCQYFSNWTPQNKIYTINAEFKPGQEIRKLVF